VRSSQIAQRAVTTLAEHGRMHPSPLPTHLASTAFTVDDGDRSGVSRGRMRALDLDRSLWGVRRSGPAMPDLEARCVMFALRMPATALFTHATAALLLRAPLPFELERETRLHISMPAPARAPHARGILGHRLELGDDDIAVTDGVRRTSVARTWCDLAPRLSLLDLVAVGDYFIHWRRPLATPAELAACASRLAGRRGARRMREALQLINDRAESRPESWLRVIIGRAGLPEAAINHSIVDTETGRSFRTDIAFPRHKVLLEYQGDYHRTRHQWRKDMTRRARLEANGWVVMEINADDLKNPGELVGRIRHALRRRGWRG